MTNSTFMAESVCFFGAKAFLILAIITAKIVYLGFLASYISGVALIIYFGKPCHSYFKILKLISGTGRRGDFL